MPKPINFIYEKKHPFRDAFFFIIICEGQNREPDYFRFFDGISSRVKVVSVENTDGRSSPNNLVVNAVNKEVELGATDENDMIWFVIDTDRWGSQLHELRRECEQRSRWQAVQSNPCFEVWLYFHAKAHLPVLSNINQCNNWKPLLPIVIRGGFNPDKHPISIETATVNAKAAYMEIGYLPQPGSTQVWQLAEKLVPLIKKELDILKYRFPEPEIV